MGLIIVALVSIARRPGMIGSLVEDAATGRRNAVPGIGVALLPPPPRPPLGRRIGAAFDLSLYRFKQAKTLPACRLGELFLSGSKAEEFGRV